MRKNQTGVALLFVLVIVLLIVVVVYLVFIRIEPRESNFTQKIPPTPTNSTTTPAPTAAKSTLRPSSATSLPYKLPEGWLLIGDKDNIVTIGHDPNTHTASSQENRIDLNAKKCCSSYFLKILPYDGGSRHEFIRSNIGAKSLDALKTSNSSEKDYRISGNNGLFLYNYDLSGSCSIGMVILSSSSAVLIETQSCNIDDIEKHLSTISLSP